jgi:hypothetical protein
LLSNPDCPDYAAEIGCVAKILVVLQNLFKNKISGAMGVDYAATGKI